MGALTLNDFSWEESGDSKLMEIKLFEGLKFVGIIKFEEGTFGDIEDKLYTNQAHSILDDEVSYYEITFFRVEKSYRGKGMGKFIFSKAIEYIISLDMEACIYLHASSLEPHNTSLLNLLDFYGNFSFVSIGEETLFSATMLLSCVGDIEV